MSAEVTNDQILSAVTELITSQSGLEQRFNEMEKNLTKKIDDTRAELKEEISSVRTELKEDIGKLDHKMDLIEQKFLIVNDGVVRAQAEIRVLQRGVN